MIYNWEENRGYIVAGVHPKNGPVKLDTPVRYTLKEAELRAKYFNDTYMVERGRLGITLYVAFNTTALLMLPPYYIDMEVEWQYAIDQEIESVYQIENRNIQGSI